MFEVRETGNPEVPLYFGEGLRRSLGNAAGCGGGGQMGCAGRDGREEKNERWLMKLIYRLYRLGSLQYELICVNK